MLATSILLFALAAVGLADVPAGYKTVYLTSKVDAKLAIVPKTAVAGSIIQVQTLASTPAQQWYLKEGNSSIQLAGSTLCLDGGAKSNWKDMGSVVVETCDATSVSQVWNVMADGRIALAPSSPQECLDLQYMKDAPGTTVGIYSCAGLNNVGAADKGINWPQVAVNATAV
ncbi:carbohydrate-binding module family 13 protein [Hyaloscypha variabilis F]|uniref:Carbohydrate-binding module family 13 protein n=1 Tax=Hyaloscypha variabilis (strain UAMH 11265 / GT02V1 / F) TaxID=1149755 RepID=A0A2J6RXD9_HYAVF|nr:carbohydrate-binding module family 13 protein [Hyaloscypha variabilis F]